MKTLVAVLWALAVGVSCVPAPGERTPDTIASNPFVVGTVHQHESRILGESRTFYLYLPPSYADTSFGPRRFPVIYVVDAPEIWRFVASAHDLLVSWGALWPQAIVVGVSSTDRARDLTPTRDSVSPTGAVVPFWPNSGGGPTFLRYIEEELVPTIDRQFRTTSHRTLVGHSLSGLFALYALSERPELFRNYMVLDPITWWANDLVQRTVPQTLRSGLRKPLALFLGRADHSGDGAYGPDAVAYAASQAALAKQLEALQVENVRVRDKFYPGEEHVPMLVPATHEALRWFFGGQLVPERLAGDVAGLEEHVRVTGRALGLDSIPDPHEVSVAAEDLLSTPSRWAAALDLFRLNVRSYPQYARTHRELGAALLRTGDTVAARSSLLEALRLAPGDTATVRRLRALGAP